MKAIFIAYDQAHHEKIIDLLTRSNCRGFTAFGQVQGRGSKTGEPHYGTHAWPSLAQAIIAMVEDNQVDSLLDRLHDLDLSKPLLGLRAFVWTVEKSI
jgi:hypothetical protein